MKTASNTLWAILVENMPREEWLHISSLYKIVEDNFNSFTKDDLAPVTPNNKELDWHRTLRNALQSKKGGLNKKNGEIRWAIGAKYLLATTSSIKITSNKIRQTAQIANSDLAGNKIYLQRARIVLPYLIRQAKAGQTIFYSDLAEETAIPNPRNLNYVLGAIGKALIKLSKKSKIEIPQIQCLVINKNTRLPGEGIAWFINMADFKKQSRSQKEQTVNRVLTNIYAFQQWDWVLQQLNLEPLKTDIRPIIEEAKRIRGNGGESPFHLAFKNFIAKHPASIGLPVTVGVGKTEYCLPSADTVDIVFTSLNTKIGVEVKSKISDNADILRGLFQCVKYIHLIEAEQIVNNQQPDCRVILALEGQFPKVLIKVRNVLGIEVIEKVKMI